MTQERVASPMSGALGLTVTILFSLAGIALVWRAAVAPQPLAPILLAVLSVGLAGLSAAGLFTAQPNQGVVLILFGTYVGSVRSSGWWWTNPFITRKKISLRARSLNGERIKVNDQHGNPVEIAAVVVWKVRDTAQAAFDVDDYERFVTVQSETAVRHLASSYPYDDYDSDGISLRGSTDKVSEFLKAELHERLKPAGVEVVETRLSHLAYSPEIAQAMLQRQQAGAIIAARQRIVEGAVGMVEMALDRLGRNKIVELDEERKAAMVSNLLVVLCGEHAATPVLNAGTLYK
ncbi:MAG: SPFH domain-containing protein [Candidatus Eisenbacteria bacterium]|uniref:SPFH domain-containing protein n=1 Tax=Eiseniibacteriota bacterium TaxID=2212470 RepID=A0A538SZA7_UNCEI|nr:MAG: SPFH domain-containing protein [Candidatus Eisenbacteria bacterium]